MRELDKILDHNEKVFWEGKPKFWPFFLGTSMFVTIFAIVWLAILIIFTKNSTINLYRLPHFWIGIFILIVPPIINFLSYFVTHYAITNKRVGVNPS